MPFELPKLKYEFNDLEPFIDAKTVEIHYSKHHQTYVNNLNNALADHSEYTGWTLEKLLKELNNLPEEIRNAVRNNGGGVYNHNLYWATMNKNVKKQPEGKLADAIDKSFGSFDAFKTKLTQTALTRFGSGWAWLVYHSPTVLETYSTANQDNPLTEGRIPLLGVDVWEHAYYLKYQNRRSDYLDNWWNVVDWDAVEKLYEQL